MAGLNSTGRPVPRRFDSSLAASACATSVAASMPDPLDPPEPLDHATPMLAPDPILSP